MIRSHTIELFIFLLLSFCHEWVVEASVPTGKIPSIWKAKVAKEEAEIRAKMKKSHVDHLTGTNFSSFVPADQDTLVKFYTPWCGHCKKLAPAWEELSSKVHRDPLLRLHVSIAEVDCDVDDKICKSFGISSYPNILHFPHRKAASQQPRAYSGERDLESLMMFVQRLTRPPAQQRIYALDQLAFQFYQTEGNLTRQQEIHDMAARSADFFGASKKDAADMYVKIMAKALSKENGAKTFFQKESERVDRLLFTVLPPEKVRELLLRKAIIGSFETEITPP
mmetsp:Transcript_4907/g.6667  ORF Transcript_4907/g.6667 Transcript_4907/m.6667 type:complete len:280 (+) Transcript_4907:204-1043(+)|eukprot:CAMPEP_0196587084 /NCGR_PEP_ID=MMETSP1081-20130531/56405_1 /TAXON_ID=36882 /ORGANISM="Pyramimonas amylifera, Strain CCMP720" /LENGTH=279 /DNA_ID=CAMNT_0041909173 /DNA_START=204 /DNA_END=1043 /DNA_ORIENTATION=-